MKIWTTKLGDEIPYNKIKDDHLINILKWIKKRSIEGIEISINCGYDGDDDFITYETDLLEGDDVLDYYNYFDLKKEADKRGLVN